MKKGTVLLIFGIFPAFFLATLITYINCAGPSYPGGADPEYNYLFNGITLAHFKFHLNAVGHPGTPVQLLIAIVGRIIHLFRPGTLWEDVMLNPELYIKAPIYVANVINTVSLFLLGWYTYKYAKNIVSGIALQLSPYAFLMTLEVNYRLMPELIMVSILCAWIIVFVKLLFENQTDRNEKRNSTIMGFLLGFSLATKLTFLPFFIMPLLILSKWKFRFRFIVLSAISFFVFAFPVLNNFHKFISWVTDIFIHKGAYGSGETGIVDIPYFIRNLKDILLSSPQLWIPLISVSLLSFFLFRRKKEIVVSLTTGVLFSVFFHFLITAKHYAFYYLVPSLLLTVFVIFLIHFVVVKKFPIFNKSRVPDVLLMLVILFISFNTIRKMNGQLAGLLERKKMHQEAIQTFKPFLNSSQPKLIVPTYYGCTEVEYALLFGLLESGKYKKENTAEFRKYYPPTLFYFYWQDAFYNEAVQTNPKEFLKPGINYTLFVAEHSKEKISEITKTLSDTTGFIIQTELLKEFTPKAEAVYRLKLIE